MIEALIVLIILVLMRLSYHWGRKDERREFVIKAARWQRSNYD